MRIIFYLSYYVGDVMNAYFQSNDTLRVKNKALSKKVEEFRSAAMYAKRNVENLEAKRLTVLRAVVELKIDGLLDLSSKQIAERYFATMSNVNNIISIAKRERRKAKLASKLCIGG